MFLNMLVKHITDNNTLTAQLRDVLPVPKESLEGRRRMESFMEYLTELIESGNVKTRQLQPARLPFFVSGWWHLQDAEHWPIFYISGRRVLEREDLYQSTGDPVDDYFRFRECFLAVASALKLPSWDCEQLLHWCDRHPDGEGPGETDGGGNSEVSDGEETDGEKAESSTHAQIQWLLAKISHKVGCKVWIAANDHSKAWNGEKLGGFSIKELPPLGLDADSQKVIRMIDVVWLKGTHQVAAAFEIEQTTSIYSGLLRMSDLVCLSPSLNFPLYLIAPKERLDQVKAQLSRPTFQTLDLHSRCGFFSCESLLQHADGILRWATSPAAIEQLAAKVEDTES